MRTFDVAIIGAGTSGLTARREIAKVTDSYVVIDDGPLGTTCARVGCMPSKVLIQVANDYDRRKKFKEVGIHGGDQLSIDHSEVMNHVRSLRDRFVRGVKSPMSGWENHLLRGKAQFVDEHTLEVNGETIQADQIIVATGSTPIIPGPWKPYRDHLITTDEFFELETLPKTMAVIGLGVIGIELGQALHHLGVNVVGLTVGKAIGALSDPEIQDYVAEKFSAEMPIHFHGANILGTTESGMLQVEALDENGKGFKIYEVEKALVAVGRSPQYDRVNLDALDYEKNDKGKPNVDASTLKLRPFQHIFMPGDVNGDRPILHEAADEGFIAGNVAAKGEGCFRRRVPLGITFSEPNIATVGQNYAKLKADKVDFVTGKVSFEGQGRSIVKLKEQGLLHVYADRKTEKILGAELHAPDGEHLAHLLAWAMSLNLTVGETLRMPFYHPVVEEGLRTALRDAASQTEATRDKELFRCQDPPIR